MMLLLMSSCIYNTCDTHEHSEAACYHDIDDVTHSFFTIGFVFGCSASNF